MVNISNDRKLTIIIISHVLLSWGLLAVVLELEESHGYSSSVIGYVAVLGASLSFGGTGLPMKYEILKNRNIDPSVFSLYTPIGLFLVTFPFLLYLLSIHSFVFLPMSVLGAIFISVIGYFSYMAVQILGYAKAPAMWAGIGMITAYLWGLIYFKEHSNNVLVSTLAILMLSLGVYFVSTSQATATVEVTALSSHSSTSDQHISSSPISVFKKVTKKTGGVVGIRGGVHQAVSNTDNDDDKDGINLQYNIAMTSATNFETTKISTTLNLDIESNNNFKVDNNIHNDSVVNNPLLQGINNNNSYSKDPYSLDENVGDSKSPYDSSINKLSCKQQHSYPPHLSVSLDFLPPDTINSNDSNNNNNNNNSCAIGDNGNIQKNNDDGVGQSNHQQEQHPFSSSPSSMSMFAAFSPIPSKIKSIRHQPLAQQESNDDDEEHEDEHYLNSNSNSSHHQHSHNKNFSSSSNHSNNTVSTSPPQSLKSPSRYYRHYSSNRSRNSDNNNNNSNTNSHHNSKIDLQQFTDGHDTTSYSTSFSLITPYPSEFINTSPSRRRGTNINNNDDLNSNNNSNNNSDQNYLNNSNNRYNNDGDSNYDNNNDHNNNNSNTNHNSNYSRSNSPMRSPSRPLLPELDLHSVKGYSPERVRSKFKKVQQGNRINYMIDTNNGNSSGTAMIKQRATRCLELFFIPLLYLRNALSTVIKYIFENSCCNVNLSSTFSGYLFCFLTGFLDGSLMLPFKLSLKNNSSSSSSSSSVTSEQQQQQVDFDTPLRYICSLGLSSILISPILFLMYTLLIRRKQHLKSNNIINNDQHQLQQSTNEIDGSGNNNTLSSSSSSPQLIPVLLEELRVAFFPGLCSGALWASANVMSVKATFYLGIKVGFPLTQTCILFAALWGVFYFKEMDALHSGYGLRFSVGILLVLLGAYALGTSSS